MAVTQEHRQVSVVSPLGNDVLLFYRMSASEELARLFEYELELLSEDPNINLTDILGKSLTVKLSLEGGGEREFNGHVSRFRYMGTSGDYHLYHATLRPWLWFLTRTTDCRIFQNTSTPDILKELFRDFGFVDFEDQLSGQYESREYCVQYNETAFNFISRLMEQEGIYYYFKHDGEKHTLILADSISAHAKLANAEEIPYFPPQDQERREQAHIYEWFVSQEIQSSSIMSKDFDFTHPQAGLEVRQSIEDSVIADTFESYEYPGCYTSRESGESAVRLRVEQLQSEIERGHGKSNVRELSPGGLFSLTNYPRSDQNKEYLVLSANYTLVSDEYMTTTKAENDCPVYQCEFEVLDSQHVFRPARLTSKPRLHGLQTAIVVGPAGEKVWTDKYGRVKVHFHWDRHGQQDENSSCWIRVSQNWAGKNWGVMQLPHIGQEVIVECVNGDPDRPIVTGRVYNGDNMPPMEQPANKTKSVIRDDYGNEIVFDASPGDEHIALYSPNHDSGIEIGKSVNSWSDSTYTTVKKGNELNYGFGTKISAYGGSTLDAKGGIFYGITAGLKYDVNIGAFQSWTYGLSYAYSKGTAVQKSDSDYLIQAAEDFIVAGGDELCLTANLKKKDNESNRPIILGDKDKLVMSTGDVIEPTKQGQSEWYNLDKAQSREVNILQALTATLALAAPTLAWVEISRSSDSRNNNYSHALGITSGVLTALAYFSAYKLYKAKTSDKKIEPIQHKDPKAKIELDKNGAITINSTDAGIVLSLGKNGEKIKIELKNDSLQISSKKKIVVSSEEWIRWEGKGVQVGKLKVDQDGQRIVNRYVTIG